MGLACRRGFVVLVCWRRPLANRHSLPFTKRRGGETMHIRASKMFCKGALSEQEAGGRGGGATGAWGGGGGQGLGSRWFAFGGAYWPLATAHSDPLWVRTCFGCVNGAPG